MRDDDGYSLLELIVAAGMMLTVLVLVASGLSEIYSDVNRTDTMSNARDQIGNSYRRLDKELRYATWVRSDAEVPKAVNGGYYLEYATTTDCRQLAFKNGVLTLASWTLPGTTPGTPTTIATDLVPTGSIPPFTVYPAGIEPYASPSPSPSGIDNGVGSQYETEHYQIRLRFTGRTGATNLPLDLLFTAQNTNRNTSPLNDCSKGRPS